MYFRAGRKTQNEVSLDEPQDSDGDGSSLSLMDTISIEDERLHLVEMSDRYQMMYECLEHCLTPRERRILILRYGIGGGEPMPQREVAKELGISRSYISRPPYCKSLSWRILLSSFQPFIGNHMICNQQIYTFFVF